MSENSIKYWQEKKVDGSKVQELEKNEKLGLKWTWSFLTDLQTTKKSESAENCVYLSWKFEWDTKKTFGFLGEITLSYYDGKKYIPKRFLVEMTSSGFYVEQLLETLKTCTYGDGKLWVKHELDLIPIHEPIYLHYEPRETSFSTQLVIEGKRVNVDKGLLAYHSDYFQAMFFSDFKEKSMNEIKLENVNFNDFINMLKIIGTQPSFPTDRTVDKLLEYADRFQMPAVICHVEHFLLTLSEFRLSKMLLLADKYNLTPVYDKCIGMIKTADHVKTINNSPHYNDLSNKTKVILLDMVCKF